MSRVLLVSSILAFLPVAAGASSITVLQEIKGEPSSIIARGTAAEAKVEPVAAEVKAPSTSDIKRVVTPMVMRGGISGGAFDAPRISVSAEPENVEDAPSE